MSTDPLATRNGEFEWGPRKRFESLRTFVSDATLKDVLPYFAVAAGVVILAIGGTLMWTSFTATAAPAEPDELQALALHDTLASPPPQSDDLSDEVGDQTAVLDPLVIVHVSGQVLMPGIVEVRRDARVFQAVEEAGGSLPDADLDRINLAAPVVDGSQIHVPTKQAEPVPEHDAVSATADRGLAAAPLSSTPVDPTVEPAPQTELVVPSATPLDDSASAAPQSPASNLTKPNPEPTAAPPTETSTPAGIGGAEVTPAPPQEGVLPAELEELMLNRETAPTPEEVQAVLRSNGLGIPAELEAALAGFETPPTTEELDVLFAQFGLTP